MLEFHTIFAFNNGDNIEPYILLAPVVSDVLVAEPYQIEPLLMVDGALGL